MLLIVALVLVALWLLGIFADVGGGLINILIVIALVVFIFHIMTGRRAA